jgi:hypothetical protein
LLDKLNDNIDDIAEEMAIKMTNKEKKRDEELPILKGKTYKRLTEYLNDTTMSLSVNPQGMGGIVRQPTLVDDNLKVSRVYNSVYYSIKF